MTDTPRVDAADVAARNKAREQLRSLEHQGEDYIWRTAKVAGDEWDRDRTDLAACRAALLEISEYWNGDRNDSAMFDALTHIDTVARAILQSTGEGETKQEPQPAAKE